MPPAIIRRLSKSFRQQQKKISCHSDSKRQSEGSETCPICWKNLPKKPQCLPCGHEFCKGCIIDLKEHAKSTSTIAKCPICRGPLEQESFKKLYKRACHHEQIGSTLIGLGGSTYFPTYTPSSSNHSTDFRFLSNEVIREYGLAAQKLEECLLLLDQQTTTNHTAAAASCSTSNHESLPITADESKHRQHRVTTLLKLQEVLKYHVLPETQYEKRISLLKEAILLSPKPLAQAHLELGKLFLLLDNDQEYYELAMCQFEIILELAEPSRLSRKRNRKARQLRGKTHFQMALAHQATSHFAQAAKHYDLAHKYKACLAYHMAAKCFSLSGNCQKAIYYGKLALDEEGEDPKCETHLLLLSIYEKFFLVEQLEGKLSDSKHYKYHQEIEQYLSCLVQAKTLATHSQERAEVFLRMDTLQGLLPWKVATIQEHFPKKAFASLSDTRNLGNSNIASNATTNLQSRRSAAFTEESSPSENSTYEMGEMEGSFYSNSLYSNSFDDANDDDDPQQQLDEDSDDDEDSRSEFLESDEDDNSDHWTADENDGLSLSMKDDTSCHDSKESSSSVDNNLELQEDSQSETDDNASKDSTPSFVDKLEIQDDDSVPDDDQDANTESSSVDNLEVQDDGVDSQSETDDNHNANKELLPFVEKMEMEDDDSGLDNNQGANTESSYVDKLEMDDDGIKPDTGKIGGTKDDVEEPENEEESDTVDESSSSSLGKEPSHDTGEEKEDDIDDDNGDPLKEGIGEDDHNEHLSEEEDDPVTPNVSNDLDASVNMEEETNDDESRSN